MMKYVASTMKYWHMHFSILSFLVCVEKLTAGRYGDYSVARMPQYGVHYEDSDFGPVRNEYNERLPDTPAHLDYKHEEDDHEKSEQLLDMGDEDTWNKSLNKKRKSLVSHNDHYIDLDKDSFDEVVPQFKTNSRFIKHRPRVPSKQSITESQLMHAKYNSKNGDDDIDDINNKNDYINNDADKMDTIDFESFRPRLSLRRKARRKARERAPYPSERIKDNNNFILEEDEVEGSSDRSEYFGAKGARKHGRIIDGGANSKANKQNDDYEEYYDMKRVLNIKNRLPALDRQKTVQTTKVLSVDRVQPQTRRAGTLLENSVNHPKISTPASMMSSAPLTSVSTTSSTTAFLTMSTPTKESFSNVSLGEKSRISILKKSQRKNDVGKVSSSKKPLMLMQVTRKIHTVAMTKLPPVAQLHEDSPERLQRARRIMRKNLVAGAHSIKDLTDNWDEMVCDYIDVALLDAAASPDIKLIILVTMFFAFVCFTFIY